MTHGRLAILAAALVLASATLGAGQEPNANRLPFQQTGQQVIQQANRPGQPRAQQAEPRGSIWGTVVSTGTGQPVDRVRLRLSGAELRGTRTVYSDDDGRFVFTDVPAGAFTLSGSKTGYVSVSYGQERPNAGRAGTPIQLAAGQQLKDLTFTLPKGGVITGIVFDEKNRPAVATPVRVLRWTMNNGERTLASAGTSTTDDRGIYRVYGLAPGNYVVSAMPRNVSQTSEMALALAEERMVELQIVQSGEITVMRSLAAEPLPGAVGDSPTIGYAPVYYPGTMDLASASTVVVGVSEELSSVDFGLQQVPLSRVEGQVIVPPDVSLGNITVRLYNLAQRVPGVSDQSARVRNGAFSFAGVPPGNYRAVAVATVRNRPQTTVAPGGQSATVTTTNTNTAGRMWAATDVPISGTDISNVMLFMQPGMTVSGRVEFDGMADRPSGRLRVTLAPYGQAAAAAGASSRNANVDENGNFTITGVVPAQYRPRVTGASGWTLANALMGGVDTLDYSLEVSDTDSVAGLTLRLTDQPTGLNGTLQTALGQPSSDYTVIVFPVDTRYWVPQSRRIMSARPTTTGQFSFQALPPGNYRVAAIGDVEPGAWFDPSFLEQLAPASIAVELRPGQKAVQNLRINR